jgi:hypothetical protein
MEIKDRNPALHPFFASILFVFYHNYFIFSIIPSYSLILIDLFSINYYIHPFYLGLLLKSSLYSFTFFICIFFMSPFYATNAIKGYELPECSKFIKKMVKIMLKSKIYFILISFIYFLTVFIIILLYIYISNEQIFFNNYISNEINLDYDFLYCYENYIPIFNDEFNFMFPFSVSSVFMSWSFFIIISLFIGKFSCLSFIIFPIQFHIWRIKLDETS